MLPPGRAGVPLGERDEPGGAAAAVAAVPSPSRAAPEPPRAPGRTGAPPLLAWRVGRGLLGLQLAGMVLFSSYQYGRFALTKDFATYSQAWRAIGRGHLDPWSTVLGIRFWRNDSEFAIWALSPLYHLFSNPVLLLWLQDAVVVATELVALGWIIELLGQSALSRRSANLVTAGVVAVVLVDPWAYETIAFDFHVTVFAAFFALLVGRDLWAGRTKRLWWWVPLALASEALGGVYLVGVGISGLAAGRRTRRTGILLIGVGLAWVSFLGHVHGAGLGGLGLDRWYGYLVGPHHGHLSALDVVLGTVRHPSAALRMLGSRWVVVLKFLVVAGLVGILSPWGFGPALVVFVPSALNADPFFLRILASFQSWPAIPFVLVGSVMVFLRLVAPASRWRVAGLGGIAVWALLLAQAALQALPSMPASWVAVSAPAAARLAAVQRATSIGTEVVASNGVMGRFGARPYAYALGSVPGRAMFDATLAPIPVKSSTVLFVITPDQGTGELPRRESEAALRYVEDRLHARVLVASDGVYALTWSPPPGTDHVF